MADWQFRSLNPNETSGASISDDNFADEERSSVEILVRETLQNPLDARSTNSVVRVEYKLVTVDLATSEFARSIFSDDWVKHFLAGELIASSERPAKMKFLVVEDFGTIGLEGCYTDSSCEGSTENWNAFWFREGEGAKTTKSNGGAGQGKITLYLASQLRSVFALTKRRSDGVELLFGCSRFKRNYKLPGDNNRWAKEARWGAVSSPNELVKPIDKIPILNGVKVELGLARGKEAGTTFIIPLPAEDITERVLSNAVVNEFFFAINRGRLVVKVGDVTLDALSIAAVADDMGRDCRLTKSYREFLALTAKETSEAVTAVAKVSWTNETKLTASTFEDAELTLLKEKFSNSELVSVDFPISVKKKQPKEASIANFRVFLQQNEGAEQSQELFVRQDLGIDGEKRLKAARTIAPVMALTFIQDSKLSDLLVAAEEPTHRNWNARRPKVVAQYISPNDVLNAVRNAALRLVQLILPEGRKDETALAVYFADPASEPANRLGGGGATPETLKGDPHPPKCIPKPKPKPVVLNILDDGFEIRAKATEGFTFPIDSKVTLAYATAVGDAFKLWDAADFWIDDESSYQRLYSGISGLTTALNTISFRL
ncbi:hypothetical protein QN386_15750 [Pseudomonas sp. CCI3.2]|uniref:hypothetical protein n=1 Tax=unclassified Pseudomonas TaxID=196821 RepID=UPI002AC9777B|nr:MULTISPECIES: hypothetical protein [unclassified Pseudomonas]MEB0075834.1 hypothetical protein [Pseudomonas sp. MH10out]MEB0102768.1 hypothetical protein [Pseudomonas sp. CCI3.2]MEB0131588.1 hypothetical protein [Pseudomonas sp. CCI2.4]MEB0156481.1 hypothetical protein [Pseudomonas sp. AH2 (2023)]MEB0170108.1 hypothetical protein [Pseudomonas sp. CCC4.4]